MITAAVMPLQVKATVGVRTAADRLGTVTRLMFRCRLQWLALGLGVLYLQAGITAVVWPLQVKAIAGVKILRDS